MSKKVYALVQKVSKVTQEFYPEQLGILLIVNSPWSFTAVWSVVKGWLDERTRAKIVIVGGRPIDELRKHIDDDQIPEFLGGTNTAPLEKDVGPWNDFEVVDGSRRGDIVGIRRISDGPNGRIFTMDDLQALPNEHLKDPQNSVEYWKRNKRQDQQGSAPIERGLPRKMILSSYSDVDTHDSPVCIQQGYSSASQQDRKSAAGSRPRRRV